MTIPFGEQAVRGASRVLTPFTENVPVAMGVTLGIRWESLCRQMLALPVDATAAKLGRQPARVHRRKVERQAAQELRKEQSAATESAPAALPHVNWHERGRGPTLLLLNGWTASGLVWPDEWLQTLESRYRVIRVDNRGTGWSRSAPGPFTVSDMADDARDVLDACGGAGATVLGTSMGGIIAQEMAIRHPQYVDRLILVSTRPPTPAHVPADYSSMLSILGRPGRDQSLHEFFAQMWGRFASQGFADSHSEVIDAMVEQLLRRVTPRAMVLWQARAISAWHGADRLSRIEAPTVVVHGRDDPLVPAGNAELLATLIRGAQLMALPSVGHLVPQEAGHELISLLDS